MSASTPLFRRPFLRNWVVTGVFCSVLAFVTGPLGAQRVTAMLNPPTVGAGQSAEYVIKYEGPQVQAEMVPDPNVEGLDFAEPSNSKEFQFDSRGASTFTESFSWQVTPRAPGRYTIPPQRITYNGQEYATEEVTLEVTEGPPPAPSLEPILTLEVGKRELFVGEVVPVTITVYFHRRTGVNNYDHPKLPRDNFVVKRFPPPGPAPAVRLNGQPYSPIKFSSSLSAVKEGELLLGPATLNCDVIFPEEGAMDEPALPRGFPRSFFRNNVVRKLQITSEPVAMKVKPLPAEGRPDNFSGAVGRFSLNAQLAQRGGELRVGEPIAVDLVVAGQGNFDTLAAPVLSVTQGWKLYPPKVSQENRSTGLEPGVQIFNQVLVPQQVLTEIPPFEVSFFDPIGEKYVTARSDAIPVTIRPDDARPAPTEAAPGGATEAAGVKDFAFADASVPEEKLTDILTVRPAGRPFISLIGLPPDRQTFWLVQAVPAAGLAGLLVWGARRRWRERAALKAQSLSGQPRELAAIRRDMRRSGLARREFYSFVREYLHAWEVRTGRALSREDEALRRVLERQALFCYSGNPHEANEATPPGEVNEALTALDRVTQAG